MAVKRSYKQHPQEFNEEAVALVIELGLFRKPLNLACCHHITLPQ